MLSPRFYTTDFAELDRTDVSSVESEWDKLIAEMRADPNKRHFTRTDEFDADFSHLPPDLDREFRDFLISSITAEFSGCVLYAEMKKRASNKDIKDLFTFMSRDEARHAGFINDILKDFGIGVDLGFLTKVEEIHVLPAEVHLLRHLSLGKDRLRPLHHDLPPARSAPRAALPSDLQMVREVVQRRVPPRRGVRAADARQPEADVGASTSVGSSSSCLRYSRRCMSATIAGRPSTRRSASTPSEYDFKVFRLCSEISRQTFPLTLDLDHPQFIAGLDRLVKIARALEAAQAEGGWWAKLRRGALTAAAGGEFARLYLIPAKRHALPAQIRLEPIW